MLIIPPIISEREPNGWLLLKKDIKIQADSEIKSLGEIEQSDSFKELNLLFNNGIENINPSDIMGVLKGRTNIYSHLNSLFAKAKKEIIIVTSQKALNRKLDKFSFILKNLKNKGVYIRIAAPFNDKNLAKEYSLFAKIKDIDIMINAIEPWKLIDSEKLSDKEKLAECVGLWLAEGDRKTLYEITFTNNCWDLINLFHKTVSSLFGHLKLKIRIYVYNPSIGNHKVKLANAKARFYLDKRANQTYYIWRLASTKIVEEWKGRVQTITGNHQYYASILRGFFAGEGNIKTGSHSNRTIRIAQGKPFPLLEKILTKFKC